MIMGTLGNRFMKLGRGYEKVSDNYKRPYILGVDITDIDKPFVLASGNHHSDMGAITVSFENLLSDKWEEHILKSNCSEFITELRQAISFGESFTPKFLINRMNSE